MAKTKDNKSWFKQYLIGKKGNFSKSDRLIEGNLA